MKRYGGIVSFRVTGGEQHALDVCAKAEVFTLGESLGGVESLIEHPGRMTHASVAGTDLEVPDDLIRLSVGIETAEDLARGPGPGPWLSEPTTGAGRSGSPWPTSAPCWPTSARRSA